ncbi:MAG: hypothetical protein HOY79_18995 [Streptomyces sp.]|nr:hypothetical protein [Streptomyces sp.]
MTPYIGVDDPSTWPDDIKLAVNTWTAELQARGVPEDELAVKAGEYDGPLEALLNGHLLRAYHCTRLLDHEVEGIRLHGMRILDEQLVTDKLNAALEYGVLTDAQYRELLQGRRLDNPASGMKVESEISFVLSPVELQHNAWGFNPLLTSWGGEAIYWAHEKNPALSETLRSLGRPTIIHVALDPEHLPGALLAPSLAGPFVAVVAALSPEEQGAEVHYRAAIPSEHVLDLWHPGDADYDRFPDLARC